MDFDWLPYLLQTSDALFPTGAYAHSLGFEEYVKLTGLRTEEDLRRFTMEHLLPVLREQELPYLRFAYEAENLTVLAEIDAEIAAWKLPWELRQASVQIGRRRLAALRAVHSHPEYLALADAIARGEALGHHLVVSAWQARVEGIPLPAALAAWFYQAVAGVGGAALKLIRIGQEGCQRNLRAALEQSATVLRASMLVRRDRAGWFDPLLEIAAMRHEFAHERLFIS